MKFKLLFIALCVLFCFWGCTPEEKPEIIELSVSTRTIMAPSEGGSYKVAVSSNVGWQLEIDYDNYNWCSVEVDWLKNDTIYIAVSRISSETPRETRIIVQAGNAKNDNVVSDTITVRQEAWIVPEEGVLIGSTVWAACNVGDFGTFAESPYHAGKLYRFNDATAYTANPLFPAWNPAAPSETWLPENNPCPAGWRLPTANEIYALVKSGYRYDETLNGFFFGRNSESATREDSKGCVFLPAGGFIKNGKVEELFSSGCYWVDNGCTIDGESVYYQYMQFSGNSESSQAEYVSINTYNIQYAFSIRCVKE